MCGGGKGVQHRRHLLDRSHAGHLRLAKSLSQGDIATGLDCSDRPRETLHYTHRVSFRYAVFVSR